MDLAYFQGDGLVSRKDIAQRQGVPFDYLDQIMLRLRRGGLVESTRGRAGGYRLAKAAETIHLQKIFSTVEDSIYPVGCLDDGGGCDFEGFCISEPAWGLIFERLSEALSDLSLASLMDAGVANNHTMCPASGIKECKTAKSMVRRNVRS